MPSRVSPRSSGLIDSVTGLPTSVSALHPSMRPIAGLTSRQRPSRSTIAMPMPDAAIATRKQSSPVAVVGLVADWGIGSRTGFRRSGEHRAELESGEKVVRSVLAERKRAPDDREE